jgi:prepilin-type N-terminal cleavage/methylation domain-containing protein
MNASFAGASEMNALVKCRARAFTVVELLVCMAVVGVVVAIALPAVQQARESARQVECRNHLRQIATACALHQSAQSHLPTGGWGWQWMGDPDRGLDRRQPGGWVFNLLAFLEQEALRQSGAGLPVPGKRAAGRDVAATALAVFQCPSRRAPEPYPFVQGPGSLTEGDSSSYAWDQTDCTGVVFRRSMIRPADLRDGASQVYLVAEAYLDREEYQTGEATNDDQAMYVGYDRDTLRVTHPSWPPLRDRAGLSSDHSFGSVHAEGFHASFCDGSVRKVRYSISSEVHRRLGNRADGAPVDASAF